LSYTRMVVPITPILPTVNIRSCFGTKVPHFGFDVARADAG